MVIEVDMHSLPLPSRRVEELVAGQRVYSFAYVCLVSSR